MLEKRAFADIKGSLKNYQYTSMNYIEYEDISKYEIIQNTDKLIIIEGYNERERLFEYCWAANKPEDVLKAIDKEHCILMFVPHEWVKSFEEAGLHIRNAWNDYFKLSLDDVHNQADEAVNLENSEIKEAAEVTLSCRNKSRGFTGETEEFVEKWLKDNDEENLHSRIFVEKNEEGRIIGLVFTTIYGYASKKGAVSWIRELCVRPEYQNKGIGRKLIMQALSHGKKYGAVRGFLAVDEMNENAIHLYKSIGFEPGEDESEIDMIR